MGRRNSPRATDIGWEVASAILRVAVTVFAFDPDPRTPPNQGLHLLRMGRSLPAADLRPRERFTEAALRVVSDAGVALERGRSQRGERFTLIGLADPPARNRSVTVWYSALAPFAQTAGPGHWSPAGRAPKALAHDAEWVRAAQRRLRSGARSLEGAAALLGDVFTADDLLRLHRALHGGPEGSERTFRRRIQELREAGILRSIRASDVAATRNRVARFRSSPGTGGRPPQLLRCAGSGAESEELFGLRGRRLD